MELQSKQRNFELDEDELEMVDELLKKEKCRGGKMPKTRFFGSLVREKHSQVFPDKWDNEGYYKPRVEKMFQEESSKKRTA